MKFILKFLTSTLLIICFSSPSWSFTPKNGFVPNEKVAIQIAKIILDPIYGESNIDRQIPFHILLENDIWIIQGNLPKDQIGGTFLIKISKIDGKILYLEHSK